MLKKLSKKNFPEAKVYPEKAIQFGEGNFMRAFINWQLQQMNKQGLFEGSATVVQPIGQGLGAILESQDNLYTVILEGILDGNTIQSSEIISTINHVLSPYDNYQGYLELADNPEIEFIFSNTTEAGIQFIADDKFTDAPPQSFPAKLTTLLYRRFKNKMPGYTIIPCELIDRNGEKLKEIILQYVDLWKLEPEFKEWIENDNTFCCSLVDRIVPGYPRDHAKEICEKLGYEDNLLDKAEPFLLWVIEGPKELEETLPLAKAGLNVIVTDDMTPYRERKVHLLNGPHTAMVPLGMLAGLETVEEVMLDADFSLLVDRLMEQEIIPVLDLPKSELQSYAASIKERFKNPFIRHELLSISLNSVSKFKARLLPILLNYQKQEGHLPPYLTLAFAALILSYRGDVIRPHDDATVVKFFNKAWENGHTVAETILGNEKLWGQDLNQVPGLTEAIQKDIEKIEKEGARKVLQELNEEEK